MKERIASHSCQRCRNPRDLPGAVFRRHLVALQDQFALGEEAFRRGDFTGAVAGYESAIHMYIPFHPMVEKSAQRLWNIGRIQRTPRRHQARADRLPRPAQLVLRRPLAGHAGQGLD